MVDLRMVDFLNHHNMRTQDHQQHYRHVEVQTCENWDQIFSLHSSKVGHRMMKVILRTDQNVTWREETAGLPIIALPHVFQKLVVQLTVQVGKPDQVDVIWVYGGSQ